tara:strand:+ start:336 stop:2081 length:1746 start_codon:yes stop_codon:yes gene_type:complete
MRNFRVALAQINVTVGDLDANTNKILENIANARDSGSDLVVFPELAVTGYPPEDLILKSHFLHDNLRCVEKIIQESKDIAVVCGFVDYDIDTFNAAIFASNGKLIDTYRKIYLPNYGVFDEERYFRAGQQISIYEINGSKIAINICEDIWQPTGPLITQRQAGAELIVNINGSPFHRNKRSVIDKMLSTRAADNGVFISYVNMVGGQDELVFDGSSAIYNFEGSKINEAKRFEEDLLVTDIDLESVENSRLHDLRTRKRAAVEFPVNSDLDLIQVPKFPKKVVPPNVSMRKSQPYDELSEIYNALKLGTRDYVRKCGFEKALIALSGGIDSSLVAAIAVDALGKDNVMGVAMPSRYSSKGSVDDATKLSKNLQIELLNIPIETMFSEFLKSLSLHFDPSKDVSMAEENLQSRIRGTLMMALSNQFGWIVLTTGNKSEMGTGYATIYGDMAGGFAVIKDVPKLLVYDLCNHINKKAGTELIPSEIIQKPPSAELRPNQRDDDSLPIYSILDPILEAYIEHDQSSNAIEELGFLRSDINKIVSLVDNSEYKRRQSPPGIKITSRSFGRDRRMPIANRYKNIFN